MKYYTWIFITALICVVFVTLYACHTETIEEKGARLAKTYCSSCHVFPEPSLITKNTWLNKTLPEMAFRMGLTPSRPLPQANGVNLLNVIPTTPMVSPEDWELIKNYFYTNAPDSLPRIKELPSLPLTQFTATAVKINGELPLFCLVQADTINHKIYLGSRNARLYELDENLVLRDSFRLQSPPSHLIFEPNQNMFISNMGMMDPNDGTRGGIILLDEGHRRAKNLIDSMQRPVFFEKHDFNGDHLDDFVACEFGNFTGALRLYENLGNDKFKKHDILDLPGARRIVIRDVDKDGKPDLIVLFTQGREQIVVFKNKGDFNFDMETLLSFSPVYGSSYFDLVDFNHDGKEDIIYTNGDNLDFSPIFKPYHGVRIFLNEGGLKFKESWFHPLYGASMAMARDFDGDGDIDIAAISFFPDFTKSPEKGFMYFENNGKDFTTYTTPFAKDARWLVMDVADIDQDGDQDILLAALDFRVNENDLFQSWMMKKTGLLVLRNNHHLPAPLAPRLTPSPAP